MSTKNLIKKENRFEREHKAVVVSNDDSLRRGRLLVKIESLMGDIPFWVNSTMQVGSVNFFMVPNENDIVSVKFKNKDIYSGEWEIKGSPNNSSNIDPNKYGISDNHGNYILVDRSTNSISINTQGMSITANDTFVNGNLGTSTGATELVPLQNGKVLSFVNGIFTGSQ